MRARAGVVGAVALACAVWAVGAEGQSWARGGEGWCERDWGGSDRDRYCETLTATVAAPAMLDVDGGQNGGVTVEGWDRSDVRIEARVWANARTEERAMEIARQVRARAEGGRVFAEGPRTERRENWGVSWHIQVPRTTDMQLEVHNGGIRVSEVSGDIRFDAVNGGVHLTGVGGDVRGATTNGGLHIELTGDRWAGAGLDARTTNGGVRLYVPDGYSADLETATVNGGFEIDFPVTVQGRIGRRLETRLGSGGPPIRAVTTNGGVRIVRR